MKKCTVCKVEKDTCYFNNHKSSKDGLQNICKDCSKDKAKKYYHSNKTHHQKNIYKNKERYKNMARNFIFEHFSTHPCVDCGNEDIRVLEFDHLSDKKMGVGRMVNAGYSITAIKKEIEKCEVRCRNCHQIKTMERAGGSWHDRFIGSL